jgi:hypothetical protein
MYISMYIYMYISMYISMYFYVPEQHSSSYNRPFCLGKAVNAYSNKTWQTIWNTEQEENTNQFCSLRKEDFIM